MLFVIEFFQTIRHLKWIQWKSHLFLYKQNKFQHHSHNGRVFSFESRKIWSQPAVQNKSTIDGIHFNFLNKKVDTTNSETLEQQSKLWQFQYHYQNDLSYNVNLSVETKNKLIDQWISKFQYKNGIAWHPYCLSIRIVNWVKYLSIFDRNDIPNLWLDSLVSQAIVLEQNLEYHLLCNSEWHDILNSFFR